MAEADLVTKVEKYVKQLKNEDKIGHALARLDRIDMTIELLSVTNVGKVVNRLRDHDVFGEEATRIVEKWKETARKNGIRPRNEREEGERKVKSSSGSCDEDSRKRQRSPYDEATSSKSSKPKTSKASVPTAFEQMLCSGDNVAVKTRKPKPVDWNKQRPEIDLNYRPLPAMNLVTKAVAAPVGQYNSFHILEEEEFNPEKMFKPRNDRVKVFAGKKKGVVLTEVPTLFQSCLRVIGNNINAIEETGDIPFDILKPVLEKCTAQQLMYIEMRNPLFYFILVIAFNVFLYFYILNVTYFRLCSRMQKLRVMYVNDRFVMEQATLHVIYRLQWKCHMLMLNMKRR
uniref:TFIIS N-terminal domain-containing protein n=1 Tax=Heterorhabditis bacteriophora TaxID=37862 RepID=A0A1I7WPY1_HETBA